jgi:hypothetical protein
VVDEQLDSGAEIVSLVVDFEVAVPRSMPA